MQKQLEPNCLYCQSSSTQFWFDKQGANETYPVRICTDCSSAMIWPRPSQESMNAYYQGQTYGIASAREVTELDTGYYPDSRKDAQRIVSRIRKHTLGEQFMDVGSGTGFFSREATEQGFQVTALEPNPNSAAAFKEIAGFDSIQQVLDKNFARQNTNSMNVVLLSQVLEHISDLDEMLECLVAVLKPGGVAAIALPHFGSYLSRLQGKRDMYISPPEHVNFFSIPGLDALFSHHGFQRVDLETVSKIPTRKIEERLGKAGTLTWRMLYTGLYLANKLNKGMVINAYYQLPV